MKQRSARLVLLAILLLAAVLRFHRLDVQSFWNDEGNSARIAERSLGLILAGAEGDIHPPGYYLLLHYWRVLFGQSEYALRALSVVAGLVLVVFTYLLGFRLFGQVTALGAAFLAAIAPLAIYYSQEVRMYMLLACLSAVSNYLLLRLLTGSQVGTGGSRLRVLGSGRAVVSAVYVLVSAAGLYTQYAFPFILFVHNGVFTLWWLALERRSVQRWRWLLLWAGMQLAIAIMFLPWLRIALASLGGWASAGGGYQLGAGLLDVWRVLLVGITLPLERASWALAVSGVLALAGLWPNRQDRAGRLGLAAAAISLLLPIVMIFAFDLYKPAWLKFLVVVLSPCQLLVAHGIGNTAALAARLSRRVQRAVPAVACALLFVLVAPSLRNLYYDPAYARDDYRQIARDIAAARRAGEGIVLNAPNQWEVFTYYYPYQDVYPAPYRPSSVDVDVFLAPLLQRHQRFFVLYWGDAESDPQRLIETALASQAYKANDRWYGHVRLAEYGVARLPGRPTVSLGARFGDAILLHGYALGEEHFRPGTILPVTLFWQAVTPIREHYKVTVQLLDSAGQLVAQSDTEPGAGLVPTTIWLPGETVVDRSGVRLPDDLPVGQYALIVAIYHPANGERLPANLAGRPVGDYVQLGAVVVAP